MVVVLVCNCMLLVDQLLDSNYILVIFAWGSTTSQDCSCNKCAPCNIANPRTCSYDEMLTGCDLNKHCVWCGRNGFPTGTWDFAYVLLSSNLPPFHYIMRLSPLPPFSSNIYSFFSSLFFPLILFPHSFFSPSSPSLPFNQLTYTTQML